MSVRIISLNIWGGRRRTDLLDFIERKSKDIDIFCFQEVLNKKVSKAIEREKLKYSGGKYHETPYIYKDLCRVLKGFDNRTSKSTNTGGEKLGIFVRKGLAIKRLLEVATDPYKVKVYDRKFVVRSMIQVATIEKDGKEFNIINIHGLWQGGGKKDTPERIKQSALLIKLINKVDRKKLVLCGDFNLEPNTKSIGMLDGILRDLIKENNIKTTRNKLYTHILKGKFADYTFVSKDIKVKRFKVLKDMVSDHMPMYIEAE